MDALCRGGCEKMRNVARSGAKISDFKYQMKNEWVIHEWGIIRCEIFIYNYLKGNHVVMLNSIGPELYGAEKSAKATGLIWTVWSVAEATYPLIGGILEPVP